MDQAVTDHTDMDQSGRASRRASLLEISSDVAFTEAVKAVQAARGSRNLFEDLEARGGWPREISEDLAAFLGARTSVYLATASAEGQPTIQHRGGPAGFLRVLDARTLAFADYHGNRQYITTGNLSENPRSFLFAMDYETRRRVKLWGQARVVEDADFVTGLMPQGYRARPVQAIVFEVVAWDVNCSQHIPLLFQVEDVAGTITQFQARVRELQSENDALKARIEILESGATRG